MEKFTKLKSKAVLLDIDHIDTDQIIPSRFLKLNDKKNFGDHLFRDWRYDNQNKVINDFPLNNYKGQILIAGHNFGCGSSREHAAWALQDYGFKVIISSFFADIFKNNALNNGILPIQTSKEDLESLKSIFRRNKETQFEIDVEKQVLINDNLAAPLFFDISKYKKDCLINGYDDIDLLVKKLENIKRFENVLK